jgi:hypothetical protein
MPCWKPIHERAQRDGRTVSSLMEEALWGFLGRTSSPEGAVSLPTDGQPAGRMLVDLDDKDAVWGLLDAGGYK